MNEVDEEKTLARLFLNLKGAKIKQDNWVDIAKDCKQMRDYYGSAKKLAEKLGVSYELIRSVLKLATLPEEVKLLMKEGKILYDVGQRISRISDRDRQVEVARIVAGLPSHDARDIIQFAKKYPKDPLDSFKKRVIEGKDRVEKLQLTIVPLKDDVYIFLKNESRKRSISTEKLISLIIDEWINQTKGDKTK
jgi:hypothetical protein